MLRCSRCSTSSTRGCRPRFLFGPAPVETDWRLFTTLVRFDAVYQIHFKCSLRKLIEYEHLWPYARDLYQWPGVAETVSFDEIRRHYYLTHPMINPSRARRGGARRSASTSRTGASRSPDADNTTFRRRPSRRDELAAWGTPNSSRHANDALRDALSGSRAAISAADAGDAPAAARRPRRQRRPAPGCA